MLPLHTNFVPVSVGVYSIDFNLEMIDLNMCWSYDVVPGHPAEVTDKFNKPVL